MFFILTYFLGASIGSFFGLVETRLAHHQSIVLPRSHCDYCGHSLNVVDLIPTVSYLIFRRKCRYCRRHYDSWSFQVELFLGIAFLQLSLNFSWQVLLIDLVLSYCYLSDLREQKILTFLPVGLSLVLLPAQFSFVPEALFLVALVTIVSIVTQGMGAGDLILLFPLSLVLGIRSVSLLLLIACSLIILVYLIGSRPRRIPFVPYLAWAFIITKFFQLSKLEMLL
ncbi:prepilin peptidase [Xylocopilactobacillus apicola]|uniref:Type 4 prepilin-like proteins leader peptide-processing enzyme n=1 Tax=Xylocopilactobacillus apicola TaxID=2932184 RepID=A0AAU9DDZ0_9LACO|nr:A24 family peptidase [Xylocopilactobacillus apicola]BDR59057.1 type 4 prepilin-like proteins leader peptide-processing enzyme [Xylocopilactobacillus apicola]